VPDPAKRLCTIANFISMGRLLLLIPLFIFLKMGDKDNGNYWAMAVMAAALVSDMLDGFLARLLKQESDWGKMLDPVADKLWICSLALFLAQPWRAHPLPWGFLVLILARDLTIITCGIHAFRRTGIVMTSNWVGKITMFSEALTLIAFTINWTPSFFPALTPRALMWVTVPLIILSAWVYAQRFRNLIANAARNASLHDRSTPLKVSS